MQGETRQQHAEWNADHSAYGPDHQALDEKDTGNRPTTGSHRPQDGDILAPLHHGGGQRVIDQEHADEERDHAERRQVHLE